MRRLLWTVPLLAALFAAWLSTPQASPAQDAPVKRVAVIIAPYLTWDDVTPTSTPTIWRLAERGAVGDINARSRTREPGEPPSPLEGALTISAGAWAVPEFDAPAAYKTDERYENGTASEAFLRMTGQRAGGNRLVFLGLPMTERVNEERAFDVILGTLGQAVEDAGGLTAAVGNSDTGYVTSERQQRVRPAALAAMNAKGLVALGDVSREVLREQPDAPFGLETDLEAFEKAYDEVEERMAEHGGPGMIVLDPGDNYRATKFEPQVAPAIAESQRAHALETLDQVVALAEQRTGQDGVVMIVSQATANPQTGRPDGLGPFIVAGPGWEGYVTSSSTQREGLVTNLDVTATIIDILGGERPVNVLGNEMLSVPSTDELEKRKERLVEMGDTAVAIDAAKPGLLNTVVVLIVLVFVAATFVLVRAHRWRFVVVERWVKVLRLVLLAILSLPVAGWIMFLWMPRPSAPASAVSALLVTAVAMFALAVILSARGRLRLPVIFLCTLTSLAIIADQISGAPLSFTNFFGYSPLLAARFYGLGNEGAALLFGSSLTALALAFDEWPGRRATMVKRFGIPLVGGVTVFVAAAPFLGANVGVAIWGTVGFALAWVLMNDRHVSFKTAFWIIAGAGALIAAFAAFDLYAASGSQTHLARALGSAEQGGLGELWAIIVRKAQTNARVLTHTNLSWILIAVLGFLGFMRWRPAGDFADTISENPDFGDAITVSLVAGAVAYFTEDSGIVIPALALFPVGVALLWLMLTRLLATGQHRDPHDAGAES